MRASLARFRQPAAAALAIVVALAAGTADAKRLKIGAGLSPLAHGSRGKAVEDEPQSAAPTKPLTNKADDDTRAAAIARAQAKLKAERDEEMGGSQINTSAALPDDQGIVCLAGCWPRK